MMLSVQLDMLSATKRIITTILFFLVCAKLMVPAAHAQALNSFSFNNFTAGGAKKAGVPFQVTITAKDGSNNTLTSFFGSANLADSTGTLYPNQTADFTAGIWTGNVYITQATDSTGITVSSGAVQSSSSLFAVEADERIKFVTISSGNNQSGVVNNQLNNALSLRVVDPFNNPLSNVGVSFAITSYPPNAVGQTLGNSSSNSSSTGVASTTLTLGRKTGTYIVNGSLNTGITNSVNFYATALPDVLLSVKITPQVSVMPKGSFLAFTATGYDKFLNERSLSSVTWSVENDGGSIDSTGVFTAGSTIGTYLNTIHGSSGGVGGTATVTVIGEQIPGSETTPTPTPTATPTPTSSGGGGGGGDGTASPSATPTPTPTATPGEGVLNNIVIDPGVISALKDAQIPIIAEAFDIFGNSVANVNFTFAVSGDLGTLTQTSANTVLLTASESGIGTVTITAQQGDIVRVARVVGSVGTGLNRRLVIEEIESPQQVGEPFTISIAAKDTLNNFLTDYGGPLILTDTTGTIDPILVEPNDEGIWFVQSVIMLGHPDVSITAAGDGMIGVSNIFEVQGEPRLVDVPPKGAGGSGAGGGGGDVLGESIAGKLKELLQDRDLNRYTIARFIGAGLAAGIGILGASLGGGIMASRGLEALGRNPFAKGRLKLNLYLGILAFLVAAGLAVFASYLIIQ